MDEGGFDRSESDAGAVMKWSVLDHAKDRFDCAEQSSTGPIPISVHIEPPTFLVPRAFGRLNSYDTKKTVEHVYEAIS